MQQLGLNTPQKPRQAPAGPPAPTPDAQGHRKAERDATEAWACSLKEGDQVAVVFFDENDAVILGPVQWVTETMLMAYDMRFHRVAPEAGFAVDEHRVKIEPITPELRQRATYTELRARIHQEFSWHNAADSLTDAEAIAIAAILGLDFNVTLP